MTNLTVNNRAEFGHINSAVSKLQSLTIQLDTKISKTNTSQLVKSESFASKIQTEINKPQPNLSETLASIDKKLNTLSDSSSAQLREIHSNQARLDTIINLSELDSTILTSIKAKSALQTLIGFQGSSYSLLWRGTRDTFTNQAFHQRCDNKPNTLLLTKTTKGYVFGAFTAIPWSSNSKGVFLEDRKAFLFTLINPAGMPRKLMVRDKEKAVKHFYGYGPMFGAGADLYLADLSDTAEMSYVYLYSYDLAEGRSSHESGSFFHGGTTGFFQTSEVEMFQIA